MNHINFSVRTGEDFEGRVVDAFHSYACKNGTEKYFVNTAHTYLDTDYGTDVIVEGIPIDVTCSFSRKKQYIIELPDIVEANGENIYFGIRLGNGRITFPNPVVVVGIDTDMHFLNSFMANVCDSISSVMPEIMDIVNERFYEYCDNHDIEPIDYREVI